MLCKFLSCCTPVINLKFSKQEAIVISNYFTKNKQGYICLYKNTALEILATVNASFVFLARLKISNS